MDTAINNNPPPSVTVVHQSIHQQPMGPCATSTTCPSCHNSIVTSIVRRSTCRTHIFALLLCPVLLCCVPYCMKSCKVVNHTCPSCRSYLGKYK